MLSPSDKAFILNGIRYIEARGGADILSISAAMPSLDPRMVCKLTNYACDEARHAAILTRHMRRKGYPLRSVSDGEDYVANFDFTSELGGDNAFNLVPYS